jgi:mannan endo-1,4-beta-mannosidase
VQTIVHLAFSFLISLGQIDVTTVPDAGSWLLLIKDGNTTINTGPNGVQRLDTLIALAKEYNIYLYFTLTNNWFPFVNGSPGGEVAPSAFPRNFLCTDYGLYLISYPRSIVRTCC